MAFSNETKTWLDWAHRHNMLKVVQQTVPDGVLPVGFRGVLYDIKIKKQPDDRCYNRSSEMREKIARGNCVLKLEHSGVSTYTLIIRGMKKFTGGLGDDDDQINNTDDLVWQRYFLNPIENTHSVLCTDKMNGEAAHVSALIINNEMYMCGGSKNVHVLFRNDSDIQRYRELDCNRYTIACDVCECVLGSFGQNHELLNYIHTEKVTGIFEFLNPTLQHIEKLSNTCNVLKFITWSSNVFDKQLCLSPHSSINTAKKYGIDTVSCDIITNISELDIYFNQTRKTYGKEGHVYYFLDEYSNVIGILKKKTVWYILLRAIREKTRMCLRNYNTIDKYHDHISKRINEIQKWLNLDDYSTREWIFLACSFYSWVLEKNTFFQKCFPVLWVDFLNDTGKSDKI